MTAATPSKLRRKTMFLFAIFIFLALFAVSTTAARGVLGPLALPVAAFSALSCLICSLGYFASMDELGQHAQYVAWFWGGTVGLTILAVIVITGLFSGADWNAVIGPIAERFWGSADARGGFAAGVSIVLGLQAIGASLWWLGYWAHKR